MRPKTNRQSGGRPDSNSESNAVQHEGVIFRNAEIPLIGAGMRKSLAELRTARSRRERGEFLAEGTKSVFELLPLFSCSLIVATNAWISRHADRVAGVRVMQARNADLERISSLSTPPEVVALFQIPAVEPDFEQMSRSLVVALDDIQDPGNLGTIIRACDWFGVRDIVCSQSTVDVYNPKVIQSTMGAIGRVNVHYMDLSEALGRLSDNPIYGTFLDGESIYEASLPQAAVIVMGNEGHGISQKIQRIVNRRLFIPPFPFDASHVESLNVSVATAITLAEFRRHHC